MNSKPLYGLILNVFFFLFCINAVSAAVNPIDDFCASAIAQADADARKECEGLKSLQNSNVKIKGEKDSIEKEIKDINNQIQIAEQKIKLQTTIISKLNKDIGVKSKTVSSLQEKIGENVKSITSLLLKVNDKDSTSIAELFLGHDRFSDFYTEVDEYSVLNREITVLVNNVKSTKAETETQKQGLEDRKDKETDAKVAIEEQKRLINRKKAEVNSLLNLKTSEYSVAQKILGSQQQRVAQIRSRLFKFQDGEGIPFGDAYDFAVKASQATGVRPALILGVLAQESSRDENGLFGTNIGSCYVKDISTGNGVGKNTGRPFERIMYSATDTKRPSDTTAFLAITSRLGRDWATTPVSCPPDPRGDGKYYQGRGFGGGMGPTQFIPSTWEMFKKRLGVALGISQDEVSPWNYEHTIMATAIYLKDAGAKVDATFSAERNSACVYYSGVKCTPGRKPANIFYGDQVMAKATDFQEDINLLQGR